MTERLITVKSLDFNSSIASGGTLCKSAFSGQFSSLVSSHLGPFHHSALFSRPDAAMPRVGISAGLSVPGQNLNESGEIKDLTSLALFFMNYFHSLSWLIQ